jgi:hypothetical protein
MLDDIKETLWAAAGESGGRALGVNHTAPRSVAEAVDNTAVKLSQEDRTNITEVAEDNLFILHYDPGKFILNEVGLWRDNTDLLLDCHRNKEMNAPDIPTIQPDDASMVTIKALWRRNRDK